MSIEAIWEYLGKKTVVAFGKECLSAAIWMSFALVLRSTVVILGLSSVIPSCLIFSSPYFIQVLSQHISVIREFTPLLPVRIAEGILGRYHPQRLGLILSAHFFGCLVGAVFFKLICPFRRFQEQVLMPELFIQSNAWMKGLITEAVLAFLFVSLLLSLPGLLEVNRYSRYLVSIPVVPLMLLPASYHSSSYNPAALYALWYVDGQSFSFSLHLNHFIGSLVGSVGAGLLILKFLPDDPTSWIRNKPTI